jgi:rhodanese-related sulfurtransferase
MTAPRPPGVLRQAAVAAALAVAVGFAANALSPRGLDLRRNYFPDTPAPAAPAASAAPPSAAGAATGDRRAPTAPVSAAAPRTPRGVPLIDRARAEALFRDPRREQGLVLFLDARGDAAFAAGRLPGARQFDRYHLDRHVAAVLGAAALAQEIVLYCHGGDCEDSDLAAADLVQLGVPAEKLAIYAGGFAEWRQHNLPVIAGAP